VLAQQLLDGRELDLDRREQLAGCAQAEAGYEAGGSGTDGGGAGGSGAGGGETGG
jgi:hypothetical protein